MKIKQLIAALTGGAACVTLMWTAAAATAASTSPAASSSSASSSAASSATPSPSVGIGGEAVHPAVIVGSQSVAAGGSVEVRSNGWPAGGVAKVSLDSQVITSVQVGPAGTLDVRITIPVGTTAGRHTLAFDAHTESNTPGTVSSFDDTAQVTFTVVAGNSVAGTSTQNGSGGQLAFTGSSTQGAAAVGLLLLGGGALALTTARRRCH